MARTVLITVGGTHLGRAMALALAQRDSVVIASRDLERCERVVDSIVALGGDAHAERCDVTDPASVNEMFERTIARTGRLDVVVCNAGGSITGKPFPSTQLEEVRATI